MAAASGEQVIAVSETRRLDRQQTQERMMPSIKNLSDQVLLVRLNSGAEVNVAPGGHLDKVADSDVRGNRTIQKLIERGLIALQEVERNK